MANQKLPSGSNNMDSVCYPNAPLPYGVLPFVSKNIQCQIGWLLPDKMTNFHRTAIPPSCHDALDFLRPLPFIQAFYLAGGTALALQLGHRISVDLDWFSTHLLLLINEREQIRQTLAKSNQFQVVSEQDNMLFTRLLATDVSFIYQHHPLLEPTIHFNGIELASPTDIGLMKLAAIVSRGTRRDFVDLYALRQTITLDQLLALAPIKYNDRPEFVSMVLRALVYFEDAEQQPMPQLLTPMRWSDVKKYCETAVRQFTRRFSQLD